MSADEIAHTQLSRLRELCVDSNQLRALPTSLGDLHRLETLSAETNLLRELPAAAELVNDGACPLATAAIGLAWS